jgi:UDP-N-acetylmuramyl tripeptide synthase
LNLEGQKMKAQVSYPGGRLNFRTKLIGRHNLYNFLAAISAALALSVSPQPSSKGSASFNQFRAASNLFPILWASQ